MSDDTVSTVDVMSAARSILSVALASALITGIDQAMQEGHPLTQVQQIDMATMSVMTYHNAMKEFEMATEVGAKLHSLKVK